MAKARSWDLTETAKYLYSPVLVGANCHVSYNHGVSDLNSPGQTKQTELHPNSFAELVWNFFEGLRLLDFSPDESSSGGESSAAFKFLRTP